MKIIIFIMVLILPFTKSINAQKSEKAIGIYETSNDYLVNQLNFKNTRDSTKFKIKLNQTFSSKYLTIRSKNKKIKMLKANTFGYCKANGTKVRFVGTDEYSSIYQSDRFNIYKTIFPRNVLGRINSTPFYFSTTCVGELKKLTISNIKSEFKHDRNFCKLIDDTFKYNTDLVQIDSCTKTYKLIDLLPFNKIK